MKTYHTRAATALLSLALILTLCIQASAQHRVTVPIGTIIPLRMETHLSSETSTVGERFNSTVFRDVIVDGRVVVPQGARVEGHVTGVNDRDRTSKAGTIAIAFDRLIYPNGSSVQIDGTLTTLGEEGRQRIEDIDQEDRVEGGDRTRRAVVFIGGGAGVGAVIGAVAGGAKGAAVGAGVGAVLGTIGVLLSKGEKAEVTPGTEFGLYVERAFTVDSDRAGVAGDRAVNDSVNDRLPNDSFSGGAQQSTVFTSPEAIRSAQMVLRDRGYYNGAINGVLNGPTRMALERFQRDRGITVTGNLDVRTAQALGISSDAGYETAMVEVNNPRVERLGRETVRVTLDATTRSGGWRVFTDHFVTGDTLHVYVRGVPPRNPSSQGLDEHQVSETFNDVPGSVTRAIFHGAQRDTTITITSGGFGGGSGSGAGPGSGGGLGGGAGSVSGAGNPRQIAFLTDRLMSSYSQELNLRNNRGQMVFDRRQNYTENQIELLFHLRSLQVAAELYGRLIGTVDDPEAVRGAAGSLIRQARLVNRLMRRVDAGSLSATVRNDWESLRAEIRNITVTNNDLDNEDRIR
jgi:hypothetical protein